MLKFCIFLQKERLKYQKDYMESIKKLEERWKINQQKQGSDRIMVRSEDDCSDVASNAKVNK